MRLLKPFLTLGIISALTFSCNRDETTNTTQETDKKETMEMEVKSEFANDNDMDLAFDFAEAYNAVGKSGDVLASPPVPSCATVTVNAPASGFPKVITIDFGTGCTAPNGVTRKGKLVITISNKIHIPGSYIKIERENYFINNNKIEGTILYKNITVNAQVPTWLKSVTAGKITFANGNYIQYNLERKHRKVSGVATPTPADDAFEIFEGVKNITKSNGNTLTTTVTVPLYKAKICPFVSKGKLKFQGTNLNGVLDFGNGDCDNKATFTDANGNVTEITLN